MLVVVGGGGGRPSPVCDAMALEVIEWRRGTEEREIFQKQPVREGPRDQASATSWACGR